MKFPVKSLLAGNFADFRDGFARDCLLQRRVLCEPDSLDVGARPLIERKARLAAFMSGVVPPLRYSDYHADGARRSMSRPANWSSRASSRNAPMPPTRLAIAACGSRSNASTAGNFWWSAGPIRKGGGRGSARRCSPTTIRTAGWSMPAAPAPGSSRRSWSGCGEGCNRFPSADAARRAAAAYQPLRIAAGAQPRALGAARIGRRGQVSDLDRRQFAAPGRVRGSVRGQAGGRGAPSGAAFEPIIGIRTRIGPSSAGWV
jgi:hypothetical protein